MSIAKPKAILVTANPDVLLPGETAIQKRLEDLSYDVVTIRPDKLQEFDVREIMLMVVSSSVVDQAFGEKLRDLVVPIIVSSKEFYLNLGMCRTTEAGEEDSQSIEIISACQSRSPHDCGPHRHHKDFS
jgi:phosphoribosylformylglycinamidine (FGAM) synthase PurS component